MIKKNYTVNDICDLKEMLCNVVSDHADRVAFLEKVDGEYIPITYRKYMGDVFALGTELAEKGLTDAHIMILGENGYAWALSYMSIVCGLGVAVPVDRDLPENEICEIAKRANVSCVIHSGNCADKVAGLGIGTVRICFDELDALVKAGNEKIFAGNTSYIESVIDENALCALLFTSGTTGTAKGVMLSHKNICFSITEFRRMVRLTEKDTLLSVLPMHYAYECTFGFLAPISCGATVAYGEGLRHFTRNMKEVRPTKMFCVPVLLEAVYNKLWSSICENGLEKKVETAIKMNRASKKIGVDLTKRLFSEIRDLFGGRLDLVIVGGESISPVILAGLREVGIKAIRLYGLTECASLAALNRDRYYRDSSEGLPTPSAMLEVYNVSEDGIGEIRYRGANIMLGYYNDPERTAAHVRGGWLYTGDLGYIDEDGFLHVIGRKENVITAENGKSIFPEELETHLSKNPFIKESVVVGIANEEDLSLDLVAVIVPDKDTFTAVYGEDFTEYQMNFELEHAVDSVNKSVRPYKQIDMYITRENEFEKTASKKIKRSGIISSIIGKYKEMR